MFLLLSEGTKTPNTLNIEVRGLFFFFWWAIFHNLSNNKQPSFGVRTHANFEIYDVMNMLSSQNFLD
jgi:hypothetical protein